MRNRLSPFSTLTARTLQNAKCRQRPESPPAHSLFSGRGERIRTFDPLVPNQMRYQAALHPERAFRISPGTRQRRLAPSALPQRRWYCVAPNRISRSLSPVIGLRRSASTLTPRCTAAARRCRRTRPSGADSRPARCPGSPSCAARGRWRCRRSSIRRRRERALRQPLVDHAVEALGLVAVAVDRVGELLRRVHAEVMRLAEHRPDAAHLEHQPLQHLVAARGRPSAGTCRSCRPDRPGSRPTRTARSAGRRARRDR